MTDAPLAFDEAIATAATGDIWLFRGTKVADLAIRTVTNAPVNHVGMVVALDDLPPLLWHAELGRSLPDVWTGEHQRGVQLHRLADAVRTWEERYGQRAWTRQLEGTIDRRHEDALMQVIANYDGRPFPRTAGLARTWLDEPLPPPRLLDGDALLRRARRDHLPGDGTASRAPARRLVRPGALLERGPHRDGPAVRARGRGRRRLGRRARRPGARSAAVRAQRRQAVEAQGLARPRPAMARVAVLAERPQLLRGRERVVLAQRLEAHLRNAVAA